MPCTRMAIPLRSIATGEGHVGISNEKNINNLSHPCVKISCLFYLFTK
jgi:hypothetical protein